MKRIDGQIWIDKKPPYRLKYHINGIDFTVEVAATYDPVDGGDTATVLPAGTVVALRGRNTVVPATFPDDINGVLGITLNKAIKSKDETVVAAVTQSGYLILDSEEAVDAAFPFKEDLLTSKNRWQGKKDPTGKYNGVGAPVYWFIGKTAKTEAGYKHIDSTGNENGISLKGKLTFQTPSGYKWNVSTVDDDTMNIAYDNLPIIGTVASYELSPEGKIVNLAIHLNFSKFDSSIEWNWPYLHVSQDGSADCGKLLGRQEPYVFHHGLFADNDYYSQVSSYTDISASLSPTEVKDGTDINVETISKDMTRGDDRYTSLVLHTPETMYYRISGEVHYKFDKEHK